MPGGLRGLDRPGSGGFDTLKVEEPPDIVDEIGEADLHFSPLDADRAHEQAHAGFLVGKDMLNTGSDNGFTGIGSAGPARHIAMGRLLVMDLRDEAVPLDIVLVGRRTVSGIGPDGRAGIAAIQ